MEDEGLRLRDDRGAQGAGLARRQVAQLRRGPTRDVDRDPHTRRASIVPLGEAETSEFSPPDCAEWLEGRLPRPVDDLAQCAAADENAG